MAALAHLNGMMDQADFSLTATAEAQTRFSGAAPVRGCADHAERIQGLVFEVLRRANAHFLSHIHISAVAIMTTGEGFRFLNGLIKTEKVFRRVVTITL
jgi:hypothetical protein